MLLISHFCNLDRQSWPDGWHALYFKHELQLRVIRKPSDLCVLMIMTIPVMRLTRMEAETEVLVVEMNGSLHL
jgi:hypothetical protein